MVEHVILIGAGLSSLVAAYELSKRNVHCIILDQESEANLGGQAFWSLGGIFCVNSSDQRKYGVKDSHELALADWMNSAQFDREGDDFWPRKWAHAFVRFAAEEMEAYVKGLGLRFLNVGWAERGSGDAGGHGNSVPRFHLTWGTGPEVVRVFAERVMRAAKRGLVEFRFRHKVDELVVDNNGAVLGVSGEILEPTSAPRGVASSRVVIDTFELRGKAVLIASGGLGGNVDLVKKHWPVERIGPKVPDSFVIGVPAHVDGRMIDIAIHAGARVVNMDRMWHYTEGLHNWDPIWPDHGIRIIPGPSSLWLDATGKRLPPMLYPGCDTLATLKHICSTGYHYSWFILDKSIIAREFSLSGSEQNPDITNKSTWRFLQQRIFSRSGTAPVQNFMDHGADFVVQDNVEDLVAGMNKLSETVNGPALDLSKIKAVIDEYNQQVDNPFSKDAQKMLVQNARNYWPEWFARISTPHKLGDAVHGPLIAVRLNLLTRKTLGGLETDLNANVLRPDGTPFPNLYGAGEVAGFGGGGVHGYNALEGTFLGGCIFSGYTAGRAMAELVASSRRTSAL